MTGAVEGAEDDVDAGRAAMAAEGIGPDDAVLGVTASGRTPFVLAALDEARRRGAATAGLSCNAGAALSGVVEFPIEVVVGNEFIAGSTRLKSGTAQKLVLNMISTITMVRLGHTYRNYMVDMRVSNAKLAARAARMVGEITGADIDTAAAALSSCDNQIKTAVVMIVREVDAARARDLLDTADGRLAGVMGAS
jgi:N-acetylmuramic acid 6-phosphate etherase